MTKTHAEKNILVYLIRAIMRSEEAVVVGGLLRSLNVVDCNLCLKVSELNA